MDFYFQNYILVVVNYVSKWVEFMAIPGNELKSMTMFLKRNIFSIFNTPREIIRYGVYLYNDVFIIFLAKYGV